MTTPAAPRITRRPALPLVWVVPIVALLVAGWMVARQFRNRGPEITIEFANGSGVEAGKTELEYDGVSVGTVRSVVLEPDLNGVLVQLRLAKTGARLARGGSQFWIVHPEVSLTGIRGLETLVSGVRLRVQPGNGPPMNHFRGLDHPPTLENPRAGRAFILRAESLDWITPGAPVYYRGIKVGMIETTRLSDDSTAALVRIRIFTPYADLVRTDTEFWNISGFSFHLGLHGAEFRTTTVPTLFEGGVSFATPERDHGVAPPALEGTEFILNPEENKDAPKWHPHISIHPLDNPPDGSRSDNDPAVPAAVGMRK